MKSGGYKISDIYQGGYSSFSPSYGELFTGYHAATSDIGAPTKPDSANVIQQVTSLLNQGIKPIEVGVLSPETFDQIPKQHFKEINRMAKLTGAKMSLHAPIVEPSGFTQDGWSEINKQIAERQLTDAISKAVDMDKTGKMPVTIHSSGIPGTEYKMTGEGKKISKMIIVNQESGKMAPVEEEIKYIPGMIGEDLEKGKVKDPKALLNEINATEWDNSLNNILFFKENADKIIKENEFQIRPLQTYLSELHKQGKKFNPELLEPTQRQAYFQVINAYHYLENAQQHLASMFNKAYKYCESQEEKQELIKASETFKKNLPQGFDPAKVSDALQRLLGSLESVHPALYKPVEEFALKHSAETLGNVAFNTYSKFKENSPVISIENLYPGMAFSMGDEMKSLIEESRKQFVKKAVENGISESSAKAKAEKLIGMTLDVGHINLAKKQGFKDKDILKEVDEIKKYVKHVHLTDNFGYSDSHLPPGMGNVPFKEILEKLEKEGFEGRKIVEAGGFVQHFGASPYPYSLEAMGSPIYAMQMAPYWNQAIGAQQGYFSGYGMMLPQTNYETFGAGFSQLPSELGGQRMSAGGSRMSGTPME